MVNRQNRTGLRGPWIVAVAALTGGYAAGALGADPNIEISSPWARATPPVATTGAAYLELKSLQADRLIGATTSAADHVEMHATTAVNGVAQMRLVTEVVLTPGKPVAFAPGGLHFMLLGLKSPLQDGATLILRLRFEHAGEVEVSVPILKLAPGPGPHSGHRHP